jgi:hypothetical protein
MFGSLSKIDAIYRDMEEIVGHQRLSRLNRFVAFPMKSFRRGAQDGRER